VTPRPACLGWLSGFLVGSGLGSGRGSDLAGFPLTALRRGGMGAALSRLSGFQVVALSIQLQNVHVLLGLALGQRLHSGVDYRTPRR
jgi:hypothetical protein